MVCLWFSGADRLYENIVDMIGYRPLTLMKYCWKYVTPVVCIVSAGFTLIQGGMVILGNKLQCYSSSSLLFN